MYGSLLIPIQKQRLVYDFGIMGINRVLSFMCIYLVVEGLKHSPRSLHDVRIGTATEVQGWDAKDRTFVNEFLDNYWQKRPIFIKGAIDVLSHIQMSGEDLIELSIDEDVESRVITAGRKIYGPFEEDLAKTIPSKDWTILVQEVDRHIPAVADLWDEYFHFVPSWRRDDVMVSYSKPEGGIGAHVDNYDVFLIQGRGRRRWTIENTFLSQSEERRRERKNCDTRLLDEFNRDQSWDLEPGDMLYLPARIPHEGVALSDDCMTVSMGFRAPGFQSLLTAATEKICRGLEEGDLLSDTSLDASLAAEHPGCIRPEVSSLVQSELAERGTAFFGAPERERGDSDNAEMASWLGEYLTIPLRMHLAEPTCFYVASQSKPSPSSSRATGTDVSSPGFESRGSGGFNSGDDMNHGMDEDVDYHDNDDGDPSLPLAVRHPRWRVASSRQWGDVQSVLADALSDPPSVALRLAEGTRICYSNDELFINGESFTLPKGPPDDPCRYAFVGPLLCDRRIIPHTALIDAVGARRQSAFTRFLLSLMRLGFYYPVDI